MITLNGNFWKSWFTRCGMSNSSEQSFKGVIHSVQLYRNVRQASMDGYDTTSGKFSVKSAYVLAKGLGHNNNRSMVYGQSSGESADEGKWKRIWYIITSMKFKFFLWHCLQGILHVNTNLAQNKVQVGTICPVCGLDQETTSHVLLNCDTATRVWLLSPFWYWPEVIFAIL